VGGGQFVTPEVASGQNGTKRTRKKGLAEITLLASMLLSGKS